MAAAPPAGGYRAAGPPAPVRAMVIASAVALHLLLFLLLLAERLPVAEPARRGLSVFDVVLPAPPPPETRPPRPPVTIAPRPAMRAGARPGGAAGAKASDPAPGAPGLLARPEATTVTIAPVRPEPSGIGSAADLAGPGAGGVAGSGSGVGRGAGDGSGDGVGSGSGAGGGTVWRRAEWIVRPSDADLARAWPFDALRERKNGEVLLACIVPRPGRPKRCRVLDEKPRGYGFGRAALSLYPQFRLRPVASTMGDHPEIPVLVPVIFARPSS